MDEMFQRVLWITDKLKERYTYIDIGLHDYPEQYQEIVEFILDKDKEYDARNG